MTTVRELLFGDVVGGRAGEAAGKVEQAAEQLVGVGALPAAGELPALTVARAVMTRVAELLDVELSDVLVGAWRTRSALLAAAHRTHAAPGTSEQVVVKTYALPWEYETELDVVVDGRTLTTLTVVADAELEVTALTATVAAGRLTHLGGGEGRISARLRVRSTRPQADVQVAHSERHFALPYEVKTGERGIPLIEQARDVPAQAPAAPSGVESAPA
ncbi:hypothetical protein Cs7R123_52060 [Catellatospora sp. TT07R-123]|uniref:hypothetical protein n=1 Tax=Catellatospora sp. TT07R-123 TaxID=2733863 RepID=UPI001B250D24|nr:hypothetical protein [Catellatospora sp. TT07R-123]GHJ47864.1 hypothetical protein Cs7R123_52060 [Catellatospora sp. TT07R-123]